ncbi:discoidin domain-containing protein [Paenibacillus rhizoplanae]
MLIRRRRIRKYPYFRNFDPYEGHSWAGGYADNDSGNNQEAAGESLFGWVGQYMWSTLTGNTAFRDASIMGFTTELRAVQQYWFNYDQDNWLPGYTHKNGGSDLRKLEFLRHLFFNGNPVYIYGIHWLPTAEYLTSYGFDTAKAAGLYSGFVADNGGPEPDWYHIVWPIQALSDPQAVLNKWNPALPQQNELFNTYWFVHNMATLGSRTKDIWAENGYSATVYKKGSAYRALVWNPTNAAITVTFRNSGGATGSAVVEAKKLVKVDPTKVTTDTLLIPPALAADTTQNAAGQPIELMFTDNAAWRNAINAVKVDGTTAAATDYTVAAGAITLNPVLFPTAKTYTVTVTADKYSDTSVQQVITGSTTPTGNLALNKAVTASENPKQPAAAAVDGNPGTRWESDFSDPQWIQVDLGSAQTVGRVLLDWEGAYAKAYTIETSADGTNWTTVYMTTTGDGAADDISFTPVNARYVKVNGTQRGTQYGYSLWELEVYGSGGAVTPTAPPALTADTTQNTAGQPIELTFTDNAAWRNAITAVKVDGVTAAAANYTVAAGTITLNTELFPSAKTYTITVTAEGYNDAFVQQVITGGTTPTVNLALNKAVTASENLKQPAAGAVDGDLGTRWESAFSDPQWIQVDLGSAQTVSRVLLNWEGAYAKAYTIETSADGTNWTTAYTSTAGDGDIDDISFTPVSSRYVKVNGTQRGTQYGYSLWELSVY